MRQEFPAKVKVASLKRSGKLCEMIKPDGSRCCAPLTIGKFRYDHILPDQFGGKPTLENCQCICLGCDGAKTYGQDIPAIAKAKRREVLHVGAKAPSARKLQGRGFPSTGKRRDPKPSLPPRQLYRKATP